MKEQRARAYAALVVEMFFSEIVLPPWRGSEFQKYVFLRLHIKIVGAESEAKRNKAKQKGGTRLAFQFRNVCYTIAYDSFATEKRHFPFHVETGLRLKIGEGPGGDRGRPHESAAKKGVGG